MKKNTQRGGVIRDFLLQELSDHPRDIVSFACGKFGITRQAVNRYVRELVAQGKLEARGTTSGRRYSLKAFVREQFVLPLAGLREDEVWRERVAGVLRELPANVLRVWQYAFTEMVNNVIDHSLGTALAVDIEINAVRTRILVSDDGVGIFRKIMKECGLEDERHAVLELAKGKLTTDPERHTGEGIFFTSRMLDDFGIMSGEVCFSHTYGEKEDWIMETPQAEKGTTVIMSLANKSPRTVEEVFSRFSSEADDYGFNQTVVPVRLARYGAEQLVSRSQAKRLLARLDRFKVVILDFSGVDLVGQAFADEIFRVFARAHPGLRLLFANASPDVERMINRARAHLPETTPSLP